MIKKTISVAICASLLFSFIGCGNNNSTSSSGSGMPSKINELGNTVQNIDEMPNWTGKKWNLKVWMAHGNNAGDIGKKAKDDKFRGELERATGIKLDDVNSYDNNGESSDSKVAKIMASNTWPDIAINLNNNIVKKLADANKIYDLTEATEKYATNYMSMVNSDKILQTAYNSKKIDGKAYSVYGARENAIKYWDENYDPQKYISLVKPEDSRSYFWIRDDILTDLYPEAKTQSQIQQLYLDNGEYTKEDMRDVVISSPQEFKELLTKIKDKDYKEGNRKVWPFYTHNGTDNWDLLTVFASLWGTGVTSTNDYFVYYDREKEKLVYTIDQPWFKESLKFYEELIWDGLSSRESIIDNKTAFDQKKLNGEYAILYGNIVPPTEEQLKQNNKKYSYRKVLIDVPLNTDRFVKPNSDIISLNNWSLTVFNKNIKEEDLEQIIRFIDFFYSDAGMNFSQWGPEKSGLYKTDANGNRQYTDERFKNHMLYSSDEEREIELGRGNWVSLGYFATGANKHSAKIANSSKTSRDKGEYSTYWNYGLIEKVPNYPFLAKDWAIWNYSDTIPGVKKFWDARQAFEDSIKTLFTANNEDEFEKSFKSLKNTAVTNGLDDSTLAQYNKQFEEANKEFIVDFKNWNK